MNKPDLENLVLPIKRRQLESSPEEIPGAIKKVQPTQSESETEYSDSYLDDLEIRLEEQLGPVRVFEDEIFIASPYDKILTAEMSDNDKIKKTTGRLGQYSDGVELSHFVEFLTGTKA